MSTFGKRTVLLRKALGLTQKEFASAGDFSQSNLSLLENDGVIPNLNFILNISTSFTNINLNWWIQGRGAMFVTETTKIEDLAIDPDLKKFLKDLNESVIELKMTTLVGQKKRKNP